MYLLNISISFIDLNGQEEENPAVEIDSPCKTGGAGGVNATPDCGVSTRGYRLRPLGSTGPPRFSDEKPFRTCGGFNHQPKCPHNLNPEKKIAQLKSLRF